MLRRLVAASDHSAQVHNLCKPMSRPESNRRRSITSIAIGLIALACCALMGLNIWLAVRARQVAIDQSAVHSENLARAVAGKMDGIMADVDHAISAIQFELQRTDLSKTTVDKIQPVLVNYVSQMEQLRGLFVYDSDGKWIVNSEPDWDKNANNSDREYFKFHRDSSSESLHIGPPIISRSSNRWVIPLSKRINREDGTFGGVILATLDIANINLFFDSFNINKNGGITLVRTDGVVIARRPYIERELGISLAGAPGFQPTLARRSGSVQVISPLDGKQRVVGFQHLERQNIVAVASLYKGDVLEEWLSATIWQTSLVLLACLAFVGAGAYVVILISRISNSAARLEILRDELTLANSALLLVSREDGLTGLTNRRYLDESLKVLLSLSTRNKRPIAILMIDVDDFKKYNDLRGHGAGDDCLKMIASALRGVIRRPADIAARYGGEEFVLVLPDTDEDGARLIGEAARLAVSSLRLEHPESKNKLVSISVGVAAGVPIEGRSDPNFLLESADKAMYFAKKSGKNKVVVASELRSRIACSAM